jgi:Taurine catabolism dioxygenase TauD, TfdA family
MTTSRTPIRGRSAWRPRDFPSREAYTVALGDAHLTAFDTALAVNRAAGRAPEDISADDFALQAVASDMAAWRDEVLYGRGFVVLRGLSRDRYWPDDLAAVFWGLGTHFGRAVSQSPMGDRIGHVTDVGGQDRRERAYRNSRELTLHTDRCDVVAASSFPVSPR